MKDDMDVLVVDSGSSHTILRNKRYFINLTIKSANISTIAGIAGLIEGYGQANILLPKGTHLEIQDALYSPSYKRSLLSFKDIRLKRVLDTIPAYATGHYHTKTSMIEANAVLYKRFTDEFTLWHYRLGHPGSNMM